MPSCVAPSSTSSLRHVTMICSSHLRSLVFNVSRAVLLQGEKLSSPEFMEWVDLMLSDTTTPAVERILEVETAMADLERLECTAAGLPKGYDGVMQLRAIDRYYTRPLPSF